MILHRFSILIRVFSSCFFFVFYLSYYLTDVNLSPVIRVMVGVGVLLFVLYEFLYKRHKLYLEETIRGALSNQVLLILFLFFSYASLLAAWHGDLGYIRRAIVLLMFVLVSGFLVGNAPSVFRKVLFVLGGAAFVIGALFLVEAYYNSGFVDFNKLSTQGTMISWFASYDNRITAGLHLTVLAVAAVWCFFNSSTRWISGFYFIAFLVVFGAIVLTFARTALLALIASLFFFFIVEFFRNKTKHRVLFGVLLLGALTYLALLWGYSFDRGLTYRDKIWIVLLGDLSTSVEWLLGKGPAAAVDFVEFKKGHLAVHPHSIYVETIYRLGLIGLVLFVTLVIAVLKKLYRKCTPNTNDFFIALVCGCLAGMFFDFSNLLYTPNLLWMWLWLPIGVAVFGTPRELKG